MMIDYMRGLGGRKWKRGNIVIILQLETFLNGKKATFEVIKLNS